MDGNLFSEWVKKLDRKFAAQERKVALIIDNCPAHPSLKGLQGIELIYRSSLVRRYIANIYQGKYPRAPPPPPPPNILEEMILLTAAWDRVSSVTLVNCFRKAGISSNHQLQSLADNDDLFQVFYGRSGRAEKTGRRKC